MNFKHACPVRSTFDKPEGPTVFIVDADASLRDALEALIRSAGWQPKWSAAAEEFLALPQIAAPSCVLADTMLPGMSGLELQQLVRDRTEMPIIFMSDSADVLTTVRAMKAGAFD